MENAGLGGGEGWKEMENVFSIFEIVDWWNQRGLGGIGDREFLSDGGENTTESKWLGQSSGTEGQ